LRSLSSPIMLTSVFTSTTSTILRYRRRRRRLTQMITSTLNYTRSVPSLTTIRTFFLSKFPSCLIFWNTLCIIFIHRRGRELTRNSSVDEGYGGAGNENVQKMAIKRNRFGIWGRPLGAATPCHKSLSRVSTLTCNINIAIFCHILSVYLSVCGVPVLGYMETA